MEIKLNDRYIGRTLVTWYYKVKELTDPNVLVYMFRALESAGHKVENISINLELDEIYDSWDRVEGGDFEFKDYAQFNDRHGVLACGNHEISFHIQMKNRLLLGRADLEGGWLSLTCETWEYVPNLAVEVEPDIARIESIIAAIPAE